MAVQSKNTIKKVYDVYKPSDYELGEESSTNLNPKREIDFSKIEIIRKRLQEVTDDIIRRKIIKEVEPEAPISISLSPGALPDRNSLLRQAAQINSGSIGLGVLFPIIDGPNNGIQDLLEPIIGSFPAELLLEEFDHPLSLDCKEILRQYDFAEVEDVGNKDNEDDNELNEESEDNSEEESEENSDTSDEGGNEEEGDTDSDEDQDEFEACAMIEMNWLKIILILLRIIKIIQILLDLILAIIVPLLEIVLLALMCWLIPPAAEQLRQRITEMVMAIIIMIITRLLQMIFNLLNLDCLCDQTMDIIAQIRQALSAFSSIMSVFNVESVNMMAKNTFSQLQDPMDQIEKMLKDKKEAWDKMKQEWNWDNLNFKDLAEKTKEQIRTGVTNAISTDPNVQKVTQTATAAYNFMKKDIGSILSGLNKLQKNINPPAVIPESGVTEESMIGAFEAEIE
jgi:hypothetical protein